MKSTPPPPLSCSDALELLRQGIYEGRLPDGLRARLESPLGPPDSSVPIVKASSSSPTGAHETKPAVTGVHGTGANPRWLAVEEHLRTCAECREQAVELLRMDSSLRRSLRSLAASVRSPAPQRIADTLRRLREEEGDFKARVYVRRSLRLMFWIVFLPLTFLLATAILTMILRYLQLRNES